VAEPFWANWLAVFAGTRYGGNPVACARAAALEYMQAYDVVGSCRADGTYMRSACRNWPRATRRSDWLRPRMLQAIVFDPTTHQPDPHRRLGLQVALEADAEVSCSALPLVRRRAPPL